MKRTIFIAFILILLIFAACAPEADKRGVVVRSGALPTADTRAYDERQDVVYTTKTGTKYHEEDCSFLKKSKIPVALEQALAEGKTPCSRCHPED